LLGSCFVVFALNNFVPISVFSFALLGDLCPVMIAGQISLLISMTYVTTK